MRQRISRPGGIAMRQQGALEADVPDVLGAMTGSTDAR